MRKMLFSKITLFWVILGFMTGSNMLRGLRCLQLLLRNNQLSATEADNPVLDYMQSAGRVTDNAYNKEISLLKRQRILCWIMTGPANHKTKATAVKDTWAKRCDVTLFMSSLDDKQLPTIKLDVLEGRNQLWGKTREAFLYIWKFYKDQADWFFKADDDTFAIIENLRYFLAPYDSSMPYWFGHRFQHDASSPDFVSGGAGYVLSKEALRRFVELGYPNGTICRQDHGTSAEDVEMARCLKNLNVLTMDTRDSRGRERFFPLIPGLYMSPNGLKFDDWFANADYYPPLKPGLDYCSDTAITFHYVEPDQMHLLNYLVYKLQHGANKETRPQIPEPPPDLNLKAPPYWRIRQNIS